MKFLKKHYGNILFVLLIAILLVPQTRLPIQVFIQRLFSSAPGEIAIEKRETLTDYKWQLQALGADIHSFEKSKEKVIVLNFWATWCPPCVAEMPSLQSLFNKYRNDIDFYFVSTEDTNVLQKFLQKKGYTIPVYQETETAPALLQTGALPTTFVISKSGNIVTRTTGAAAWNSEKVHHLLDKLLAE